MAAIPSPAVAGSSNCCFANGTPGCDDRDCEGEVCALDAFCCDTSWDAVCAAVAEDLPFLEQQQIGLNSRFARQGRFAALEPSVGTFAYWYAQQLLSALIVNQEEHRGHNT